MIDVPRKGFLDALKTVAPAVKTGDNRYTGRVRLTGNGNLTVQGFNGDLGITAEVDTAAMFETTVVPFDPLLRFVTTADADITIDFEDNDCIVKSGTARLALRTMDAADLPRIVDSAGDPLHLASELLDQIGACLYAASPDPSRPILTGLGLIDGWAVCTDSYRLSAVRLDANLPDAIIPADVVRQVIKTGGPAFLAVDDARATFGVGTTRWTTRLIMGSFPQWQRLVGTPAGKLTADRQALLDGLEQVDLFGSEWVRLEAMGDQIGLGTRAQDGDTAAALVKGTVSDTVSFTLRYLVDLLKALPGDEVDVGMDGASKPAVVGTLEGGKVDLLMPVRQN